MKRRIGRGAWLAMIAACLLAIAGRSFESRLRGSARADNLLEKAYSDPRTLELRLRGAAWSLLRERASGRIRAEARSADLLRAEAEVARLYQANPVGTLELRDRGRANLLEWSFDEALGDFHLALAHEPESPEILNDLATAYYERGEAQGDWESLVDAYELESRAVQARSGDTLLLFNRAVIAKRLGMYGQSMEDWRRVSELEKEKGWAEEARSNFQQLAALQKTRLEKNGGPLLSAREFADRVQPEDPTTWKEVEPRVEEYVSEATRSWLPAAFPRKGDADESARRALKALAIVLERGHGDRWLRDLLWQPGSDSLADAVASLSTAAQADWTQQNYSLGRAAAQDARRSFAKMGNRAGELRAAFEELYASEFADMGTVCSRQASQLQSALREVSYPWLSAQTALERYNCELETGNFGASEFLRRARQISQAASYAGISLRALNFLAADRFARGDLAGGWHASSDGIREFWAGSQDLTYGYNLYTTVEFGVEVRNSWFSDVAYGEQALSLVEGNQKPFARAEEHLALAKASLLAKSPAVSLEHLRAAESLIADVPPSSETSNFRMDIATQSAYLQALTGSATAQIFPAPAEISQVENVYTLGSYYTTRGKTLAFEGKVEEAKSAYRSAVALAEHARRSLSSDADRLAWRHSWTEPYLLWIDLELKTGNTQKALAIWELCRNSDPAVLPLANGSRGTKLDASVMENSLASALAAEEARDAQVRPNLRDDALLLFTRLPDRIVAWAITEQGIETSVIPADASDVVMQGRLFRELCARPSSSMEQVSLQGRSLYSQLIAPVESQLRKAKNVLIENDDSLAGIPFQALIAPAGKYFSDEHAIRYVSGARDVERESASGAVVTRETKMLLVANSGSSMDGVQPLDDVVAEARSVSYLFPRAEVLVERQATLSAVMKKMPQAESVYFVGHAVSDGERTALLLSSESGSSQPSLLTSQSLGNSKLGSVRLAVLAACSTQGGTERSSDEADSLVRALLGRGVRHVVASGWDVDSQVTSRMMDAFYKNLLRGATVSEALAGAEAETRRATQHPYYWASFDAFGNN
ncbi:TPR repeat protein [Candidatus Koribacter versatilis Ellin345]|uniref:TPR repeat protein n=1 Tax=Koribacter versatilis (strain Ellin345) TaxID=204669 RepID=Q1IIQ3_KORVE|nr:TPR repeat protein [Candidatus Koribacter versatilis Ellin345]